MKQVIQRLLLLSTILLTAACAQQPNGSEAIASPETNSTLNESPAVANVPENEEGVSEADTVVAATKEAVVGDPRDPLEEINRELWDFNWLVLDKYVLRPLAVGYSSLPQPVQTSVRSVVVNLEEPGYALNNLFQGKFKRSGISAGRFVINSTIGVLGIFDVAKSFGLEKQKEDFGQTLGVAGVGNGAFLMLPGYGPTTLRDGFGDFVDGQIFPLYLIEWPWNLVKTGIKAVYTRADLIQQEKLINDSFDSYIFVKEAYYQNQRYELYDGNPPIKQEEIDPEFLDEID